MKGRALNADVFGDEWQEWPDVLSIQLYVPTSHPCSLCNTQGLFSLFLGGEKSFLSCAMVGKGQLPRVWNKEGIESLSTEFTPYYYQGPLFSPGLEQPNQCCLFLRTLKILWNRSSWFLVFSTDYLRFSFISSTNSVTTHHLQKFCSCCLLLFPLSL